MEKGIVEPSGKPGPIGPTPLESITEPGQPQLQTLTEPGAGIIFEIDI